MLRLNRKCATVASKHQILTLARVSILMHTKHVAVTTFSHGRQRCAGAGVQTPAGVSVFQQDPEQDQEWIFLNKTRPGAGVIFLAQWF